MVHSKPSNVWKEKYSTARIENTHKKNFIDLFAVLSLIEQHHDLHLPQREKKVFHKRTKNLRVSNSHYAIVLHSSQVFINTFDSLCINPDTSKSKYNLDEPD